MCVLYSTLQSLLIGKILVLKVLLPLTPVAFTMKNILFCLQVYWFDLLVLEGWKYVIFKEGCKWQKAECHLDLTNPVALSPSAVQRYCAEYENGWGLELQVWCRLWIDTELWKCAWGWMGLDPLGSVSYSSAFLSQHIDVHWGGRWFWYHGMYQLCFSNIGDYCSIDCDFFF